MVPFQLFGIFWCHITKKQCKGTAKVNFGINVRCGFYKLSPVLLELARAFPFTGTGKSIRQFALCPLTLVICNTGVPNFSAALHALNYMIYALLSRNI